MKRFIAGLVTGLILTTTTFALAANPIKLIVNGKEIQCDVPPQVIEGRTMIPAKYLAEALGASVDWDATNNAVVVTSQPSPTTTEKNVSSPTIEDGELVKSGPGNIQTYEKDGYFFVIENGVEYYPIGWITDPIYDKGYNIGFNKESNTLFLAHNDKPSHPVDEYKTILEGIPGKIFHGQSYIEKEWYLNKILPLVK